MLSTTIKRTMASALSGAAIAATIGAPTALARPIDPIGAPAVGDLSVEPAQRSETHRVVATAPDDAFDLSSAAIGAAAGTGLLIVVLTAGGLVWRRPVIR